MCHEGFCTGEEDPLPTAAGVWIASTVTGYQCLEGGHTDADADGFSEFCENNLAEAFAPELVLASSSADPAPREPPGHGVAELVRTGYSAIPRSDMP